MKVTIELDLDAQDRDDRTELNLILKANSMASALWQFARNTRKSTLNMVEEREDISNYDAVNLVFAEFYDILGEHGIDIDNLYS